MQEQKQVALDQQHVPPPFLPWSAEGLALAREPVREAPTRPEPTPEAEPAEPEARKELPPLAVFSEATESLLQDYFARGGELGEPSCFAAMCERAMRLSHASYPCPKCETTGSSSLSAEEFAERGRRLDEQRVQAEALVRTARSADERDKAADVARDARRALVRALQDEASCKVCKGTGATTPRKFGRGHGDAITTQCWCPVCEGGGSIGAPDPWQIKLLVGALVEVPGLTIRQIARAARELGESLEEMGRWPRAVELMRRMAWKASEGADASVAPTLDRRDALRALVAVMRDRCWRCEGQGYVVPIDVRETGSSVPPATSSADVADIAEHAELDRIFGLVRDDDDSPLAAVVLAKYYGIDGNRWGATGRQRIWSLMEVTKPGATLAREAGERFEREHDGMRLDAGELLARLQEEDRTSALVNRRLREMLLNADRAARSLLESARRAWTRAVLASGHDARDSGRVYGYEADIQHAHSERSKSLIEATIASGEHIQPFLHETRAEAIAFFGSGKWEK